MEDKETQFAPACRLSLPLLAGATKPIDLAASLNRLWQRHGQGFVLVVRIGDESAPVCEAILRRACYAQMR